MELHQVRYFIALAQVLNFSRAAELCNVTQPALTKAIRKLESELGGDLIYRERKLSQLTDLGKLLLPILERTLEASDAAFVQAHAFQDRETAPLRIGLAPTISAALFTDPLGEVARHVPGLQVTSIEHEPEALTEALLDGSIHVGIAGAAAPSNERIDHLKLFEERYFAVCSPPHPFARLEAIPIDRLAEATWLERIGCDVTDRFLRMCRDHGFTPTMTHRTRHEDHLRQMAVGGMGVVLSPEHAPVPTGLVAKRLEGDPIRRDVELRVMTGRKRPPALDAFLKVVRQRDWAAHIDLALPTASCEAVRSSQNPVDDRRPAEARSWRPGEVAGVAAFR